jgi:hypothetical protein
MSKKRQDLATSLPKTRRISRWKALISFSTQRHYVCTRPTFGNPVLLGSAVVAEFAVGLREPKTFKSLRTDPAAHLLHEKLGHVELLDAVVRLGRLKERPLVLLPLVFLPVEAPPRGGVLVVEFPPILDVILGQPRCTRLLVQVPVLDRGTREELSLEESSKCQKYAGK